MAVIEVSKILEYKNKDERDYFFVSWSDGSTSWAKVENLACKDLILEFFKLCLNNLRIKLTNEINIKQKQREEELLQKIISKNLDIAKSKEKQVLQNNIITEIVQNAKNQNKGVKGVLPFVSSVYNAPESVKGLKQDFKKPSINLANTKTIIKQAEKDSRSGNLINIKLDDEKFLELKFFESKSLENTTFCLNEIIRIKYDLVALELHNLYIEKNDTFSIYPAFISNTAPTKILRYLELLKSKKYFLMMKKKNETWFLYIPEKNDKLFNTGSSASYFIIKVKSHDYFFNLLEFANIETSLTKWTCETYRVAALSPSDYYFQNQDIPSSGKTFYLGSKNTLIEKHIITHLSKSTDLSSSKDCTSLVISNRYLDLIHQVSDLNFMKNQNINVFIVNELKFEKIMQLYGLLIFTDESFNEIDILTLLNFIDKFINYSCWTLKISASAYAIYCKKLADCKFKENDPRPNITSHLFKKNIIYYQGLSFSEYVKKRFWKDFKIFCEINTQVASEIPNTLDKIAKFIGFNL